MSIIISSVLILVAWVLLPIFAVRYAYRFLKARRWGRLPRIVASVSVFVISFFIITWALLNVFGSYLAIQPYVVQGGSMLTAYKSNDLVLVNALDRKFSRKDIVVFRSPHRSRIQIARVIGLPNEDIMVRDGNITINGAVLDEEPYWSDESVTSGELNLTLREEEYFLLGDNRVTSFDSRDFGEVEEENIIGKVFYKLPL